MFAASRPCARSGFAFNDVDNDNTNSNVSSHHAFIVSADPGNNPKHHIILRGVSNPNKPGLNATH